MFHDMFVHKSFRHFSTLLSSLSHSINNTICFTICLFISPDLDGSRALKTSLRTDGGSV
jgi:hypothetical protein